MVKKKIWAFLKWLILSGVLLTLMVVFQKTCSVGNVLCGIFLSMTIPKLFACGQDFRDITNWQISQRKLERGGFVKADTPIRISFAYLFRIIVDGKYFLVKNTNGTGKFQPVGGVYKMYAAEAQYLRQQFQAEDDNSIPMNCSKKGDYRIRIKNRYLRKFIKHFNKTEDREKISDLSREFQEELIFTKILKGAEFKEIEYSECGRHFTEIHFSEHFQCYELLMADVVELNLTEVQEKKFRELMENKSQEYRFTTSDEIKTLGVKTGTKDLGETISNHTKKVLVDHTDELIQPKKKGHWKVNITGDRCNTTA